MAEDAGGHLWFGTNASVWEFDGHDWREHAPADLNLGGVNTLVVGPDGSVFAGSGSGIARYRDGTWTRILPRSGNSPLRVNKLLVDPAGSLWAATSRGLLQQTDEEWILHTNDANAQRTSLRRPESGLRPQLLPATILQTDDATDQGPVEIADLCMDLAGRIWWGTDEGEIVRFDPSASSEEAAWKRFSSVEGLVPGRGPSLLADRDGSVWLSYNRGSGHLHHFDGSHWNATPARELDLPDDGGNLLQTRDGVIWISGRYQISAKRNGIWHNYSAPDFPVPPAHNFICQTRDGALWIGGPNTEIQRVDYDTGRWTTWLDLNFQWQSETGARWFLHRSGRAIFEDQGTWLSYGPEDGMIDRPVALFGTAEGSVWAAGSHGDIAATARFSRGEWQRTLHPQLAWGIDWRGILEAADGSLWFGAAVDSSAPASHKAGILEFRDGEWRHHHQPGREPDGIVGNDPTLILPATQSPEPVGKFYIIGQSPDGRIWAGRNKLISRGKAGWSSSEGSEDLRFGTIQTMLSTPEALWLGSRQFGAIKNEGKTWIQQQGQQDLVANSVFSFSRTSDGSVWAATDRGVSRFDGVNWSDDLLPSALTIAIDGGRLVADREGRLWINHFAPDWTRQAWAKAWRVDLETCTFQTTMHHPVSSPPDTVITMGPSLVDHGAGISVLWQGYSPWRSDTDARIQYSYRLNDGPWSPYSDASGQAFFDLADGLHRIEVRARDRDFNTDPTPAVHEFTVQPAVWLRPWFLVMITLLVGGITAQTVRIIRERHQLLRSNRRLATEIERRTRSESALRVSEANLNEAQQLARLGSWTLIHADDQLDWSPEVFRIFDVDPKAFIPTFSGFLAAVHPEDRDRVELTFGKTAQNGDGGFVEHRLLLANEQIKIVQERWNTQFDPSGKPLRSLGTVQDVTSSRELEAQLQQSQKMEAIGQLAGGVAHDFNNILAAMTIQAELAALEPGNPPETTIALQEIQDSAARAARLTRQLLLFSRRQIMARSTIDLNESVLNLTRMLDRIIGEDVKLKLQLHPKPLLTEADPTMIEQVLLNLSVNARDAMGAGGTLRIATGPRDLDPSQGICGPETVAGPGIWLAVSDTGQGIAPKVMDRMFEPFFTTKAPGEGTGLGLATVLGIVQQHQGLISVHSELGHGAEFSIILPASGQTSLEPTVFHKGDPGPIGTETILLIEDDPLLRRGTQRLLEKNGYAVLTASSSIDALEVWAVHGPRIALLFTDVILPDSLNGPDIARRLREDRADLPVIFASGYSFKTTIPVEEMVLGETLLQKPYGSKDLLRSIRHLLDA